jgi:hypothetical protein
MGGLQVLMDKSALVGFAKSRGDSDCEAQKATRLHGRPEEPSERFAAGILEHQQSPSVFAHEFQRMRGPRAVELVLQFIFAREPIEGKRGWALRDEEHQQHRAPVAVAATARSSAESAFAILP